jgi:universal stress protein family protein
MTGTVTGVGPGFVGQCAAVGSHGHSGLRAMIGSVAHGLLHLADRPVVVIPRPFVEARRGQSA